MNETGLEKTRSLALREKGQYALAFGVIALMLYVAGFPIFLLFFVGVLSFFIWKVFSTEGRTETRRIFEFYLAANEILRDDERRWYGFEIQETIGRGENIVKFMSDAPPLVYFGLGALYQKLDDHGSAVKNLTYVVGDAAATEAAIVFPKRELREYVRLLRKIERAPAESPLTSAAIRSLERARKNRGQKLLEISREQLAKLPASQPQAEQQLESVVDMTGDREIAEKLLDSASDSTDNRDGGRSSNGSVKQIRNHRPIETTPDRQTISEVLHDIYDRNA